MFARTARRARHAGRDPAWSAECPTPVPPPARQPLFSLWRAYTRAWLAYGMRLVSASLLQIGPEREEAGRVVEPLAEEHVDVAVAGVGEERGLLVPAAVEQVREVAAGGGEVLQRHADVLEQRRGARRPRPRHQRVEPAAELDQRVAVPHL